MMLKRMKAGSIRWQIAASAVAPVILVALLLIMTQPLTLYQPESLSYGRGTALKIEMVTEQVRAAETPEQLAALFAIVSNTGLKVEEVSAAELGNDPNLSISRTDPRQLVRNNLPDPILTSFRTNTSTGKLDNVIVVAVGDGRALAFRPSPPPTASWITEKQINLALKVMIVIIPILLVSLYAASTITAPLLKFAAAAETLKPDEGPDRPFDENGAAEIHTLAKSLNDMRSRVRSMIEDRTRMLRAISHDLRTPLTRLRLRAERSNQPELRASFLADIAALSDMIDDTLIYLSKEMGAEKLLNADLPSLLETVCADFTDMGYNVHYSGPERFAYLCKPRWLARAVTNLVENSTKFAQRVTVTLSVPEGSSVRISVTDDGPGLAADLRTRVLEPFFKVDTARTSSDRTGFGLGLSIVDDIVRAHGGRTELMNASPQGLIVHIDLPVEDAASVVSPPQLESNGSRATA
ncbi:ATP-binding protein [Rhizobium brockwellii]|uniref:HAMP domain-containing sensor histidine kinase n=1 Tax=Rhizobium brockwellii TaxID=3019932 RepID=UPI003F9BCEE2